MQNDSNIVHGFLLTTRVDLQDGEDVLIYQGLGECDGERFPFELHFTGQRNVFFVERAAEFSGSSIQLLERKRVGLKTFEGREVDALYFRNRSEAMNARQSLEDRGFRTYEADIRPPERFLMERFIFGQIEIEVPRNGFVDGQRLINPVIRPAQRELLPNFFVASIDIETGQRGELYSIAIHQYALDNKSQQKKIVLMVAEQSDRRELNECQLVFFPGEKALLNEFLQLIANWDPDILIGWHVIGFDLVFLERKCREHKMELTIGRGRRPAQLIEKKGSGYFAEVDGRVVIDGPQSLRNAFYQFEDFKLDTVAHELLGEGKDIIESGAQKVAEIERRFREDKESLAVYNFLDTELVSRIFQKTALIEHLWSRVCYSGLLFGRLGVSTAAFDFFFLPKLHRKGFVASNTLDIQREGASKGGHVVESVVGLHEHVIILDFKSLYPTLIQTFHIDPYSRLIADKRPLQNPSGVPFSQTEHILPERIDFLMKKRELAQERQDDFLSQAIKILMNSFYGIMGSSRSRFYHADLPHAITRSAKWCMERVIDHLEEDGYQVLYGDTDSVFVKLKEFDRNDPFHRASRLAARINEYLNELIQKRFQTPSHLHIKFEKYYRKIFFSPLRSQTGEREVGAKKRYAGMIVSRQGNEELNFVGMEFIRSDWTKLAKNFQYELFKRFFGGERVEDYIKDFVATLKNGDYDRDLVYKKKLSKGAHEYTKNVPAHVKAAQLLEREKQSRGQVILYLMTRRGPRPIELDCSDIDYQHYIDKQLRPLAQVVLNYYEKSFEDIVIGDQLNLF